MRTVIDASVAAKWYFPEPGWQEAETLLSDRTEQRDELMAPDLLEAEFVNLLWKKVRRSECSEPLAVEIRALWEADRPRLIPSPLLSERALELSLRLDHPVYDCLYLAAAIEFEAPLATSDRRLERAARGVLARVIRVG